MFHYTVEIVSAGRLGRRQKSVPVLIFRILLSSNHCESPEIRPSSNLATQRTNTGPGLL